MPVSYVSAVCAASVTLKECSELDKLPETGRRGGGVDEVAQDGGGGGATFGKPLAGYLHMGWKKDNRQEQALVSGPMFMQYSSSCLDLLDTFKELHALHCSNSKLLSLCPDCRSCHRLPPTEAA